MRLRNFLIILGLWVALLPYLGFSISAEHVLFSITGFILIVSSFYVVAIEDKHKYTRIIKGEAFESANEKIQSLMSHLKTIKKNTLDRVTHQKSTEGEKVKPSPAKRVKYIPEFPLPESEEKDDSVVVIEEDDGRPRIKKAVSDVKIKSDSIDDILP